MSSDIDAFHNALVADRKASVAKSSKDYLLSELPSNKYLFCNHCRSETNHICKAAHSREYLTDTERFIGGIWWLVGYRLWMCAGCETCTLEKYSTDDSLEDNEVEGGYHFDFAYFPERSEYYVDGKQFLQLSEKLDKLYRETLHAFNHNLVILCAAGLRSLMEGICDEKQIKGRNLEDKINSLTVLLPQNIVTNLHGFRFIGNTAVHELTAPPKEDLRLAIEICEDLLNYLYELNYKTSRLMNSD